MKKIFGILLVLTLVVCVTACGKKDDKKESKEFKATFPSEAVEKEEAIIKIFEDAKKEYDGLDLQLVATLGEQVVAGKNYMFLAKGAVVGSKDYSYKIVVVYHDLEGNSSITKVEDFDYTKYVNKNIDYTAEERVVGGWEVAAPGKPIMLEEKVQTIFDKATETLTGMQYKPIVVLGTQEGDVTSYAVLCYGQPTVPDSQEYIYVLTLKDTNEISGMAYVDLAEYNK